MKSCVYENRSSFKTTTSGFRLRLPKRGQTRGRQRRTVARVEPASSCFKCCQFRLGSLWCQSVAGLSNRRQDQGKREPTGRARLRKATLPPLSCEVTSRASTTEDNNNADLGNGADGWQATASDSPIFLLAMASLSPGAPQPSCRGTHRNEGDGCAAAPERMRRRPAREAPATAFRLIPRVPVLHAEGDSPLRTGLMDLQ